MNFLLSIASRCISASTECSTDQDNEVVDFKRSPVKNIYELTNLMKMSRIEGYNGRIHREIYKFLMYCLKLIKSDDELMIEIGENGKL